MVETRERERDRDHRRKRMRQHLIVLDCSIHHILQYHIRVRSSDYHDPISPDTTHSEALIQGFFNAPSFRRRKSAALDVVASCEDER